MRGQIHGPNPREKTLQKSEGGNLVKWIGQGLFHRSWKGISRWQIGWTATIGLLLLWPAPALATTWYPVAEASQGQQQQLVDLDSIEPLGMGQVRVASIYIDRRSGKAEQTTYITDYDCQRRWFRDVRYNGEAKPLDWFPVDPDPLNAAAMDYVCNLLPVQ